MRQQLKSIVLVVLMVVFTLPAMAQSTEGKEFWVALTLSAAPSDGLPTPFIAVSTKKPTTITITNPNDPSWAGVTRNAGANEWVVFESEIPLAQWYPTSANSINNIKPLAGSTNNYGLKVTTTEDVSVFAALWMQNSFDAANVLPSHVLLSEYYTQDYPPYIKPSDGDALSMLTILATENNTSVTITPSSTTQDNHAANVPYTVTLNAGQTYYVISQTLQSLSGTHVVANGKKIAVFQGDVFTQIPGGKAARDCTYEQAMPIEFWGTQFIVTRSKEKDANRIRVTASTNGTVLRIDGYEQATINAGETWEFEMHQVQPTQQDLQHRADANIQADAVYLESSCPVAVYSYDVSNGYKSSPSEMDNSHGDPSMVWVSPIQQRINNITFGTCYTNKTRDHFINVVTETATCQQTKLTALYGVSSLDKSSLLVWTPVPGNTTYSYARAKIGDTSTSQYSVFNLQNPKGFNAIVYGNGDDESYAYSAGSAAVEQGVKVEGETFMNGYRSEGKFCVDTELSFDAMVGTDEITRVDWNFGDGTTEYYGLPQTSHLYTTPGWYDVTAVLYGHQVCTTEDNMLLGTVQFSFRVVRADIDIVAPTKVCLTREEQDSIITNYGQAYLDYLITEGEQTILNPDAPCYENKQLSLVKYGLETEYSYNDTVRDGITIEGHYYDEDAVVVRVLHNANQYKCDSIVTCSLTVLNCLQISVESNMPIAACQGENTVLPYIRKKGHMKAGWFEVPGLVKEAVTYDDNYNQGEFILPTSSIGRAGIYQGTLYLVDRDCGDTLRFPVNFSIYYPSSIFRFKFNNVLAVYQNAGYTFTAYQWYVNGKPIVGANESVYYLGQDSTFTEGDEVFVMLTDQNGMILPSCPQILTDIQDFNPQKEDDEPAQAEKRLVNRRLVIIKGDDIYDIYGQKVQ